MTAINRAPAASTLGIGRKGPEIEVDYRSACREEANATTAACSPKSLAHKNNSAENFPIPGKTDEISSDRNEVANTFGKPRKRNISIRQPCG